MTDPRRIEDFVGISTNVQTGITLWQAAALSRKYGLTCFEIHFGDYEPAVGNPWMIPYPTVYPREFSADDRKRLRDELSHIVNLTVHGTPVDLNVAALNRGIREESRRQYREALELAIDLGAKWMTYHHGRKSVSVVPPDFVRERCAEFIEEVLPLAKAHGVRLAYECFDPKLLERIPDKSFGLLIDTGHAVMSGNKFAPGGRGDTSTITQWIDFLGDRLIEMHLHDAINWGEHADHGIAHRSFDYGLCLDLEAIARHLAERQVYVPLISEIYEPTAEQAVATLARTKETIVAAYRDQEQKGAR